VIHRQRTTDALLPLRDSGRLPVLTSVQAKDQRSALEEDSRRVAASDSVSGDGNPNVHTPRARGGQPVSEDLPRTRTVEPNPKAHSPARGGQPVSKTPPTLGPPDSQDLPRSHTAEPNPKAQPRARGGQPASEDLPLLLVDIDGVISLFSFGPDARPEGSFHSIDGIPHFLSSAAAVHLLALARTFELAWASGWEEKANEYLPHLLGLPTLPHLSFERPKQATRRTSAHWKLEAIDEYAGATRPLAWVDDAFNEACHEWAHAREAPTLLVETAPASGLTQQQAEILERWARGLAGSPKAGAPAG